MTGPVQITLEAWGQAPPDWVERLAMACQSSSQNKIAAKLDVSAALVSTVLRNKYGGDMLKIEKRVRIVLMSGDVPCPVLGSIPGHVCVEWQGKASRVEGANPFRSVMARACNRCPHFALKARTPATVEIPND